MAKLAWFLILRFITQESCPRRQLHGSGCHFISFPPYVWWPNFVIPWISRHRSLSLFNLAYRNCLPVNVIWLSSKLMTFLDVTITLWHFRTKGYCRACVCPCPHDNSSQISVGIGKFARDMHSRILSSVIENGGHWPWHSRSFWLFWLRILGTLICLHNNHQIWTKYVPWEYLGWNWKWGHWPDLQCHLAISLLHTDLSRPRGVARPNVILFSLMFVLFCFVCCCCCCCFHGGDNDLLIDFIVYYFQNSDTALRPSRDHFSNGPVVVRHNPLYITTIQDHRESGCINPAFTGQVNGSPPTKRDDHGNYQPLPYEEVELPTVPPPSYEEATKAV